MTVGLLIGREERELLRIALADGSAHVGRCTIIVGQHFLICADPQNLLGRVEGPLEEMDLATVDVLQTRAETLAEGPQRLMGERIPGREPATRYDFEHRLRVIARSIAGISKDDWQREMQIRRQFHEVADRIQLAAGKRQWVLNEERFRIRSNREPTMADLWVGPTASPSCFARPRSQDFDPDPVVRRRRTHLPAAARGDPRGLRNMLAALKAQGLHARLDRQGDPPHLRGSILVKMPIKGRAQFAAMAERETENQPIVWRLVWDGNDTKAGQRRYRAAVQTEAYAILTEVLRSGRRRVQTELALW